MSLNILSDLDQWREAAFVPGDNPDTFRLKPEAEALVVYGSMLIGMGELTELTAREYLTRLRAWEIVDGAWLRDSNGDPVKVTMEHLRPFFGTRTNVLNETAAKFKRR